MAGPAAGHRPGEPSPEEPVPFGQRFLDNIYLLLALGVAIPIVSYWVWGLINILSVPPLR